MKRIIPFSVLATMVLVISSCATIPIIGRKQMNLYPSATMDEYSPFGWNPNCQYES